MHALPSCCHGVLLTIDIKLADRDDWKPASLCADVTVAKVWPALQGFGMKIFSWLAGSQQAWPENLVNCSSCHMCKSVSPDAPTL